MAARTGLWLIGARGSVASTTISGLAALSAGLMPPTGCVTERLDLDDRIFPRWADFVVGGHDVVDVPLEKRVEELVEAGVVPRRLLAAILDDLRAADARIRPGGHLNSGVQADAVTRQVADLLEFQRTNDLERVVVVNLSPTEAVGAAVPEYDDPELLRRALKDPERRVLGLGALAAYSAFEAGCSFVDFTPSPALRIPAVTALAGRVPFAGSDGKTGESLLRSALAPMFVSRALRVRSWSGTNLLGGRDGANLADPVRAEAKFRSKSQSISALLGEQVTTPVHIDHVPDLGERKVAWDHVLFDGFLGARMSLQVTWDGYDSALAAPLVLDLARLVAGAHAAGEAGALGALAFFFKDPAGTAEHGLADQARALTEWAKAVGG